jgi:arylsulfotransferase ASST
VRPLDTIPHRMTRQSILRKVGPLLLAGAACWLAGPGGATARPPSYTPPACQTVKFHSEPGLGAQRVCMNLGVHTQRTESGSYLFLTPDNDGIGIFRDTGSLVSWVQRPAGATEEHDATVVKLWGQRYLAAWAGTARLMGKNKVSVNSGTVLLYNEHYQQIGDITAGPPFSPDRVDMHEFRITPQGDALIGIYEPVRLTIHHRSVTVVEYVVQKLSLVHDSTGIHTGKVLFEWHSLRHVPLSASHAGDPGNGGAWDYFHGNAIAQDTDGNLVISSRNTWAIYKVSVKTGQILWQVGARGDHQLAHPWCFQHDVDPLGNNEYSLFDDGGVGPGCWGSSEQASRGLIIRVDPTKRPAGLTLVHAYTHRPAIETGYLGSVQRLSNGDVLVDWGNQPEITQYSPDGKKILMDLSLSYQSYRGFRYAWVGAPTTKPSVAAQRTSSSTKVWASWNGATRVVAWRVLAGPTQTILTPAGPPVAREGFETRISLNRRYSDVAVQALGAGGQVLGTSEPISPTAG